MARYTDATLYGELRADVGPIKIMGRFYLVSPSIPGVMYPLIQRLTKEKTYGQGALPGRHELYYVIILNTTEQISCEQDLYNTLEKNGINPSTC